MTTDPAPRRKTEAPGKKKGGGKKKAKRAATDATAPEAAAGVPIAPIPPAFGPPLLAWIERIERRIEQLQALADVPPTSAVSAHAAVESAQGLGAEPGADGPTTVATDEAVADGVASVAPASARTGSGLRPRPSLAEAWAQREAAGGGEDLDAERDEVTEPDGATERDGTGEPGEAGEHGDRPDPSAGSAEADDVDVLGEPDLLTDADEFALVAARPSAVLVARELLARGSAPGEVRRRLRDRYGVEDPDAVLELA